MKHRYPAKLCCKISQGPSCEQSLLQSHKKNHEDSCILCICSTENFSKKIDGDSACRAHTVRSCCDIVCMTVLFLFVGKIELNVVESLRR